MRWLGLIVCLTAGLALADVPTARAQGIYIGPGGVEVDPGIGRGDRVIRGDIDRGDAMRIARRQGLVDIDSVSRSGRRWIVEGVDRRGRDRQVVINGRTGEVVRYN